MIVLLNNSLRQASHLLYASIFVMLSICVGPVANGETLARLPAVESRVDQLEAEIAELRARLEAPSSHSAVCCEDWSTCCVNDGLIAGYEATFLKYHYPQLRRTRFDYEMAPRLWVGYVGPTGVGIRARYWDYQEVEATPEQGSTSFLHIDTQVFDLELTNWVDIGRYWSALVTGGWRYVGYDEGIQSRVNATGAISSSRHFASDSVGGTLGGELHAHITTSGTLFASARSSIVMGDQIESGILVREADGLRYMWESQMGAEWKWECPRSDVFIRVAAELQYWHNFTGGIDRGASGFNGFSTACGFVF